MRLFDRNIVELLNGLFDAHAISTPAELPWQKFIAYKQTEYRFPREVTALSTTAGFPWFIAIYYCHSFFRDSMPTPILEIIDQLYESMIHQLHQHKAILKQKLLARFCGHQLLTQKTMLAYQRQLPQSIFNDLFAHLAHLSSPYNSTVKAQIEFEQLSFTEPKIWISQQELILSFSPQASFILKGQNILHYVLYILNTLHLFPHTLFYAQRMEHRFFIHIAILTVLEFSNLYLTASPRCHIDLLNTEKSYINLPSNISSITFGDMHASVPKMLSILASLKIVKHADANILIRIYNSYILNLNRAQKSELIKNFSLTLNETIFKKTNYLLRFIGDTVADWGRNDFFMLLIFEKLKNTQQEFTILFSNHDASLILFYYALIKKNLVLIFILEILQISL